MAIERAVDATDPRLRAVHGYRKRLHAPVIHAIDHAIALVDAIPAPLAAFRGAYRADPRLGALFVSDEHMLEVFADDRSMRAFLRGPEGGGERAIALLLAERAEKRILGMELSGDSVRRDVLQIAVNFGNHRLADPSANEEQTRRQLKRRAFDHVLTMALTRIVEAKGARVELAHQRELLRRKLVALERGRWSFENDSAAPPAPAELSREIEEIEVRLQQLGGTTKVLKVHLDIVAEVLGEAERQLWSEAVTLPLDPMNIQRDADYPTARQVVLHELHNARGARLVHLLVSVAPGELPNRGDFLAAAQHHVH